jgi:multidrug transporter EmrE-like cation transporter
MEWALLLVFCSIIFGVSGELLFKVGAVATGIPDVSGAEGLVAYLLTVLSTPAIILGFLCYGIAAILWIVVLSRLDLSYAYPMLAFMYALVPIAALVFLREEIPLGRWVGIGIIIIGITVVFRFGGK